MSISIGYYEKLSLNIQFINGLPYWSKRPDNFSRRSSGDLAGCICKSSGYRRISCTVNKITKLILAHRLSFFIRNNYLPFEIDHIDFDKDNNDPSNLRDVTKSQNLRNRPARGRSKYKGVSFNKVQNKWFASINLNGKQKHLGYFFEEDDAAKAYDRAVIENNLQEFAGLNIPCAVLFEADK